MKLTERIFAILCCGIILAGLLLMMCILVASYSQGDVIINRAIAFLGFVHA